MSSPPSIFSGPEADLVIVGGGIVGLWSAWVAARRGLKTVLIEKRTLGSGASGGILGALMPHQPTGWSPKKQFQLDGLLNLPERIAELEAATGRKCGYARIGRVMPIAHAEKRRQSQAWAEGAAQNWPAGFDWHIRDENPISEWAGDIASHGWNIDTLSARLNPRALCAALAGWARAHPDVTVREETTYVSQELQGGDTRPHILAAGLGTFDLVDPQDPARIGTGVKGQGALLKPQKPIDPASPIIYDNGTYVIAHADGNVAVGSTSENDYGDPGSTDGKLDAVIAEAARLCPPLHGAEIIERWAGVRAKAGKPDPLLGPLPRKPNRIIATGGFKITFAIAHLMADAAVAMALGETAHVPDAFLPAVRLGCQPTKSPGDGPGLF